MPGFLVTANVVVQCVHGGQAQPTALNPRVKIMGSPIPIASAAFTVIGCAFTIPPPAGPGPTPCTSATFLPGTTTVRVFSMGQPLLCMTSLTGPSISIPPAPPLPLMPISFAGQTRVQGM
jgi:hypothetical protein